ncbi:hypothetical protein FDI85_gp022 [Erwinia phage Machina]|uniref:Uncharacterized protein n=2 Tax=Machinavirus machina TaxID=2169990 RepID=A0A1B2IDK1_9CAUD|nr:hypothetical protein BIZ81_gp022 [Erwinia phage vB_EamM_Huxley]YP_009617179.1 hypothetical protein FDI85_gp022 [Erwinia phage Machina]ANZ49343.1 hypothetical protein HUXLEY_261 [Erwinia phage vB_EamM_Huxley]ANZ49900.1 hypothetical protein MACHINA_262 [Erwinia phage Machina]
MSELLRSFLKLHDGSKDACKAFEAQSTMDERAVLVRKLAVAVNDKDTVREAEIRKQLFGTVNK